MKVLCFHFVSTKRVVFVFLCHRGCGSMYGHLERLKAVDVVLDEPGRRRVVALDLAGVFELTEDGLGENLAELRRRKTRG